MCKCPVTHSFVDDVIVSHCFIPSWKFSSCLKCWWQFSHRYRWEPRRFPPQVPQTWSVDWVALSLGVTPGAGAFRGAADSPVALLGRGFSCQCSIFISQDEADTLASWLQPAFPLLLWVRVCVCGCVSGCVWVLGAGLVGKRRRCLSPAFPLRWPRAASSWISPVGDATACVLRPQIARWFSVGLLSRPVVHSWGWLGSLSTLSAAQTGPQLHAPKQFGVAHLKIEAPNPARWGGQGSFSVGRRPVRPHQPCLPRSGLCDP